MMHTNRGVAEEGTKAPKQVTLAFTGDVMLGRGVNEMMRARGYAYPLGNVATLLSEADLTLINLECVIALGGERWRNPPRAFYFRSDPHAVLSLKEAGIDYVTLANNHSLDFGYEALLETFEHLEKSGIRWAGAGKNIQQAKEPRVLQARGMKFAIFAATDNFPEYGAGKAQPGTWYVEIPPGEAFFRELGARIASLRAGGVDVVIFSLHWGPNMVESPPAEFQEFARRLIDLGVDLIHGHSAHVFQGIEIYKGKIIFYDTGDFVDDYYVSQSIDEQFLYLATLEANQWKKIELIPVKIADYRVQLADEKTAERAVRRMRGRSEPFGTKIVRSGKKWIIPVES